MSWSGRVCTVHIVGISGRDDVRTGSYPGTYERSENQPVRAAAVRGPGGREGQASADVAGPVCRGAAVVARPPRLGVLRLATSRVSRRHLPLYHRPDAAADVRRLRPAARHASAPASVCVPALRPWPDVTFDHDTCRGAGVMRWLQLRFDFDSTAVRLLVKGH